MFSRLMMTSGDDKTFKLDLYHSEQRYLLSFKVHIFEIVF